MEKQDKILNKEKSVDIFVKKAHSDHIFEAKKTPPKWIKFFNACSEKYDIATVKNKTNIKIVWFVFLELAALCLVLTSLGVGLIKLIFLGLIIAIITHQIIKKIFKAKYANGFYFFTNYLSAFFTLIEEDLMPQSKITLTGNLKTTMSKEFIVEKNKSKDLKEFFYEKEICRGTFTFTDNSVITFQFIEKIRKRVISKTSRNGNLKTKKKYKAVYPFTLKMKIPKEKYNLNPDVKPEEITLVEDENFYTIKVRRKFDPKTENPDKYKTYSSEGGIYTFSVDYFAFELVNLINTCYTCVTPK